jgi:hypothetical protein
MCRGLDEQVAAFGQRPLEGDYPYLWLDAKIEPLREPGGVLQKALVIAYAVHKSGRREDERGPRGGVELSLDPPILAANPSRGSRPSADRRLPKDPPCGCAADRPWTAPTTGIHPR